MKKLATLMILGFAVSSLVTPELRACSIVEAERKTLADSARYLRQVAQAKDSVPRACRSFQEALAHLGEPVSGEGTRNLLSAIRQNPDCVAPKELRIMISIYLLGAGSVLLRSQDPADIDLAGTLVHETSILAEKLEGGMKSTFAHFYRAYEFARLTCSLEMLARASCATQAPSESVQSCRSDSDYRSLVREIHKTSLDATEIADRLDPTADANLTKKAFEYLGSEAMVPAVRERAMEDLCITLLAAPKIPVEAKTRCQQDRFVSAKELPRWQRACKPLEF